MIAALTVIYIVTCFFWGMSCSARGFNRRQFLSGWVLFSILFLGCMRKVQP